MPRARRLRYRGRSRSGVSPEFPAGPEFPPSRSGVSGPSGFSALKSFAAAAAVLNPELVRSLPGVSAQTGVSGLLWSGVSGVSFLQTVFPCSPRSGVSALLVRSLRTGRSLRPPWSGVSGLSGCNGSFSGRGIYTPPPTFSHLALPSTFFPFSLLHC